jgi:outer membrane protein TolC
MRDQRDAVASAGAGFRIAQTRYRNGLSAQLSTLDAENTFIGARRTAALLDGEAASARVSLLLAVGGEFEATKADSHQDNTP